MKTLNLCGSWQFREAGADRWLAGEVPGSVLGDLLRAGEIPDPFWRENEYAVRALFEKDYEYCRSFTLPEGFLSEERAELCCEGLDTLAKVYLNGQLVLDADNMHRTWITDVKAALQPGENQIRVYFSSPIRYTADAFKAGDVTMVSAGCMPGSNYLRKAHCMFGWDWGPQLPDAGIWRPIFLRASSGAFLEEVYPVQRHADGQVTLIVNLRLSHCAPDKKRTVVAALTAPDGETLTVSADTPDETAALTLLVKNPKLWWPNGLGEQPLYRLAVSLDEDGAFQNEAAMNIGLRTLKVSTEPDEHGREFAMTVNGVKAFSMGADYIPEDSLFGRITPATTEKLIKNCVRANFNSIRVWGGGYYPDDWFYDLCDRYGLLVWQDLMYACNIYEIDEAFEQNIAAETADNVKRLRHHPSLALWCGNNEMELAWLEWENAKDHPARLKADYLYQFEYLLKRLVKKYDPETFYWPSSPSSGGSFDNPGDPSCGDVHYWEVWHGRRPFTDYRNYLFRYCSEFGFQSFPSFKTVESFTLPEDRNIFSPVMESHQKNDSANGAILAYLADNYRYPKDFDSLIYVSQLLQAQAIQYGVEHWRRHRRVCMGAIYWQLNDCWPVASWASVDYFGRWKALHYTAKRFFAPLTASILDEGSRMAVWVENEQRQPANWKLEMSLKDMGNQTLWQQEKTGTAEPLSSAEVLAEDFAPLVKGRERQTYFEYRLWQGGKLLFNDAAFFTQPKQLELPQAAIRWTVDEQGDAFVITLTSDAFAHRAELSVEGADAVFEDNYIPLTGGERAVLLQKADLSKPLTAKELAERLRVRSLRDSY